MKKKKNRSKLKKKVLNQRETSNPQDAEFKTLDIRMLRELRGGVDKLSEKFNKEKRNKNMEVENIFKSHK